MRNKKLIMTCAIAAMIMTGCGQKNTTPQESKPETTQQLSISQKELTFTKLGQTEMILTDDAGEKVTWTSSDETVATVAGGVVIAKGNGTALITGKTESESVTCTVKVNSDFSIAINEGPVISLNSKDNNKMTLTANVTLPTVFDEVDSCTFSSSDETVATVDQKTGEVTAVGKGIATITATTDTQRTTKMVMMGMESVSTSPATASVTVVVDNEFDPTQHAQLIGTYQGSYDWRGFDEELSETYAYTEENFKWIQSILSLELSEDGTFHQKVLNAQREGYPADAVCPEVTDPSKSREVKSFYVYNRFDQVASDLNNGEKEYHDIEGMSASGVNNFIESGVYAIFDGNLVLFYKGMTKNLGPVNDMEWAKKEYEPFVNMVKISENMTMQLTKED